MGKMDDLGYPLRVEPKRDRIILNKASFKKAVQEITIREILKAEKEIIKFINEDVSRVIEGQAIDIFNQVMSLGDTSYHPKANVKDDKSHWAYKLGSVIGEAIVNGIDDIFVENRYNNAKR